MKKSLILFTLTVFCVFNGWARTRSYSEMLELARQHFTGQSEVTTRGGSFSPVAIPSSSILTSLKTKGALAPEAFYVFNLEKEGFVIISGDDQMKPILGYSAIDTFRISNLPDNMRNWLQLYANQFNYLSNSTHQKNIYLETRTADSYPEAITPLLGNIIWDQDRPYNNRCPEIEGEKTVTGCVATAMAQVMKYYNYPEKGISSHKYTTNQLKLECELDFSAITFKWDKMLPSYLTSYTKENADAVAELMYSCGVAVEMDYNTSSAGGSGAVTLYAPEAMSKYFQYDPNARIETRAYYTNTEWTGLLKKELTEKRPVIYAGSSPDNIGHAFIFDGYDRDGLFHINWGWSGYNNGYFEVWELDPASPGIGGGNGGGFNINQRMITGIQKSIATSKYKSNFLADISLVVSKTSISRNEIFAVTTPAIFNYGRSFKGKFQLVLVKDQQVVAELGQSIQNKEEIIMFNGIESHDFTSLTIPQAVAVGDYQLYYATKDNKEASWSLVKAPLDQTSYFHVKITDNQVLFTDSKITPDLEATVVTIEHNLYMNKKGDYTIKLKNKGEEYFSEFGLLFVPQGSEDQQAYLGAFIATFIMEGEEKTLSLSKTVDMPAGNYDVYPGYSNNGRTWETIPTETDITATVLAETTEAPALTLYQKIFVKNKEIKVGEPLTITIPLKNTGGPYDGTIAAAIFEKNGSNYTSDILTKNIFLDKEKQQSVTISKIPNLSEGDFTVSFCYSTEENGFNNWLTPYAFGDFDLSVKGYSTANETVNTSTGISIYPTIATSLLNIKTVENLHRIEFVNLSGITVKQIDQKIEGGNTYKISVSALAPGVYFLKAHTEQQVYTHKFIKK